MGIITLIATGHTERGICNSLELYKIIEQVAPQVIFEEVPPSKFEAVYDGKRGDSLETKTIKRYLQKYTVKHFPIDLDTSEMEEKSVRNKWNQMALVFNLQSNEYINLLEQHDLLTERLGFPYLNSCQCTDSLERKRCLEEEIVRNLNHAPLSGGYNDWLHFNDQRENEMIRSIYRYSTSNKYDRALVLIGAEHRKPLMEKIARFEYGKLEGLQWTFDYFS